MTDTIQNVPAPPKGKQYTCPGCGAGLSYSAGNNVLECAHCGHREVIPQSAEEIRELSYQDFFRAARLSPEVVAGLEVEVKCPGCSAMVMMASAVSSDNCTFCGTHLENPTTSPTPMMRPQAVLPFQIDNKEARRRFDLWVASRWFAPNALKQLARLGQLKGVYVPYWTYDSMTFSYYTGMRGDHYWVTVTDSKGNSRQERRTRWSPVSGRVNHFFDDILICASRGMPPKLIPQLGPWDLNSLVPLKSDYLTGFRTERYQVDAESGFTEAKVVMDATIASLVRGNIGGDEQRVTSIQTQYSGITFKHILLPVWVAAYKFQNRTFVLIVNARTGEVQGERPWSWIKILLFTLLLIAILVPILMLLLQQH